jgi:histidinol-phosphate aminotransferase
MNQIFRENILSLKPYSSARSEFETTAALMLDANENSLAEAYEGAFNRYPDPFQKKIKERVSALKGVAIEQIFIGNGSDEAIDLLLRATCRPGQDSILICPPTYGMYEVAAHIQDAEVIEVPLRDDFQLDVDAIRNAITQNVKLLFLCSPNNPTGNLLRAEDIRSLLETFPGLVILDEAYIDFAANDSWLSQLDRYPNLVILQTLSKAWGLAGARFGLAFAAPFVISILNKIKAPYNVSKPAQDTVLNALNDDQKVSEWVSTLTRNREELARSLAEILFVERVYPSDANFLLVRFLDAGWIYQKLLNRGIVVRNRSNVLLCENCLRITVGSSEQNEQLLTALRSLK